ncbi:uncharacterized protein BXZ73DRAFT_88929 [Epithele typhae]|uniref:uncharacterized protein n=1 Tax=Epithele typhae TaxID=378194 RepID=UPI0020075751|nr:uncharacterized protein BXZ73DRAFT_88929 [Epithele typhae]KAH9939757.1 hypothetical protein BXZ73DRAFT_88929 [Epithele typhae]
MTLVYSVSMLSATSSAAADSPTASPRKRKTRESEQSGEEKLEDLLTSSKSKLTNLDISDIVNYANFLELSPETQQRLCSMLPSTAFLTYVHSVSSTHPDAPSPQPTSDTEAMDVDPVPPPQEEERSPATLDPAVLTSPFFLSAAHTFQDHLFSSWLGKKAASDLERFLAGARAGTLSADWKDEVWARDHAAPSKPKRKQKGPLDLAALAKRGFLQVGDVLAYRRTFPSLGVTVEKDLLVDTVHPTTHALCLLLSPGTTRALPAPLLLTPTYDDKTLLELADVTDVIALERGLLDVDARVSHAAKMAADRAPFPALTSPPSGFAPGPAFALPGSARHAGATTHAEDAVRAAEAEMKASIATRAWKAFTVYRRSSDSSSAASAMEGVEIPPELALEMGLLGDGTGNDRGGRGRVATLFYLRGCCAGGS